MNRKAWSICMILMFLSSAAAAQFNPGIEAFYSNMTIFDAKNQNGGGGTLLFDLNSDIKALLRGTYTFYNDTRTVDLIEYDVTYFQMTGMFGLEYDPPVNFLSAYRLVWRNSLLLGYSRTGVTAENEKNRWEADDSGFAAALNTGMGYNYSQHLQLFVDVGWHHSFYRGILEDSNIFGVQVLAGVRCLLAGARTLEGY